MIIDIENRYEIYLIKVYTYHFLNQLCLYVLLALEVNLMPIAHKGSKP